MMSKIIVIIVFYFKHKTCKFMNMTKVIHAKNNCMLNSYSTVGSLLIFAVAFSILVVFPQDLLERGLDASNFAMLGLGDIVIPGNFSKLI